MSVWLSCRSFSALAILIVVSGGCTTGQIGEKVSGELVLNSRTGETLALLKNPTEGGLLTSRYGNRTHPITGMVKPHRGIDLAASTGTPVLAAENGTLLFQGDKGTFGNLSRIKHGTNVVTSYAHLDRFELGLTPGASIKKGQVIGYVGTTGRSSGPHLHYEVLIDGEHIDPLGVSGAQVAQDVGKGLGQLADGLGGLVKQVGSSITAGGEQPQSLDQ